ncbi:MAG: hypothetical protein Q7R97_03220 [Candidatus Daviesbacteria bacterium]|nr:hypothetical protein [Candidatus Daviesbacteria bacterium]
METIANDLKPKKKIWESFLIKFSEVKGKNWDKTIVFIIVALGLGLFTLDYCYQGDFSCIKTQRGTIDLLRRSFGFWVVLNIGQILGSAFDRSI